MWIPKSIEEIEELVTSGQITETLQLDVKREMPKQNKNIDIAKDITAMTVEGGTILYGVEEDANGRPYKIYPIELKGARERIDLIVQTSISEPPDIQIREYKKADDPSVGCLAIIVCPSPRAPHMVILSKDNRFYGRSDTGNVRLTQAQVELLYARRKRWEVDRDQLLDQEIEQWGVTPEPNVGFLYLFGRPVSGGADMLEDAAQNTKQSIRELLYQKLAASIAPGVFSEFYPSDFNSGAMFRQQLDGWMSHMSHMSLYRTTPIKTTPQSEILSLKIDDNGGGHLVCGGAAAVVPNGMLILSEALIAGLTTRFTHLLAGIYDEAGYVGQVDLGIAVIGIEGARSSKLSSFHPMDTIDPIVLEQPEYRRHDRFSALKMLEDPRGIAKSLVMRLIQSTNRVGYDPFEK
jgi:hypothetical protein